MRNIPFILLLTLFPITMQAQQTEHDDFGQDSLINPSAATYLFDIAKGPVKATDESLATNYQCPAWFRNAKFGIYMHWGINSIPGYDGHYGRWMYWNQEPDSSLRKYKILGFRKHAPKVYKYHVEHFGHPSKFGYKDFIPMWKATRFNADSLAAFYKEVGAKFIGVMAVHHDNFDLYDSSYQPWNSVNMGPKLDIVKAWQKACEKVGVHFAVTSHLSNYCHENMFYQGSNADTQGAYKGVPYDYMNPIYDGLYGKRTPNRIMRLQPEFAQNWYQRTKELIDKYEPDLLYFDGPLPEGIYGQQLAAHFYNKNLRNGKQQGVLTIKRLRPGFTLDWECSSTDKVQKVPFLVDTTINPGWFYMGSSLNINEEGGDAGMGSVIKGNTKDKLRMKAGQIVDNLVDIVSKNGNMMLNVGLRADGSLPETFRDELVKIGNWLKLNGEAIYDTRPYRIHGEGTYTTTGTGKKQYADYLYSFGPEDYRFTTKPNTIYVITLGWPGNGKTIEVKHLGSEELNRIKSVTFVANGKQMKWQQKNGILSVTMPKEAVGEYAYAFKISL